VHRLAIVAVAKELRDRFADDLDLDGAATALDLQGFHPRSLTGLGGAVSTA
jgi:hypothetical protein